MTALTLVEDAQPEPKPRLSFMQVTPEIAARWLKRNTRNRKLRIGTVARYARDMAAGKWQLEGSPIKFAPDGTLLDGQHRLAAVIESGATILTAVAFGIDPAAQDVMDNGRARTTADQLAIAGEKNASALAAAARFGLMVERNDLAGNGEYSHEEEKAYIANNPDLRRAVEYTVGLARKTDCPPSVVAYSFMMLARIDLYDAANFWLAAADKVGLKSGDPVIALTHRFAEARRSRERLSREAYLSAIYRAWNFRRAGKQMRLVKIASASGGLIPIPEPK